MSGTSVRSLVIIYIVYYAMLACTNMEDNRAIRIWYVNINNNNEIDHIDKMLSPCSVYGSSFNAT